MRFSRTYVALLHEIYRSPNVNSDRNRRAEPVNMSLTDESESGCWSLENVSHAGLGSDEQAKGQPSTAQIQEFSGAYDSTVSCIEHM